MSRFTVLSAVLGTLAWAVFALEAAHVQAPQHSVPPPNLVLIVADDLGYGDLSVYGHPTIRTTHLDRMAAEGLRFTQFYSADSVCTPSRAALLTGRLPVRSGMVGDRRRVLYPNSSGGLPASEVTLAEVLRERGYATTAIGKWHLGHLPEHLPMRQGFDSYFGIPYSNDMDLVKGLTHRNANLQPKIEFFNVPLMRNAETVERPADQRSITKRYTEEATRFMREHRDKPFFVYLAHTMPHVPLFASEAFAEKSPRGIYGDVVEEIDWSVGQVLQTVRDLKLERRTLVLFTSDNGPWLPFETLAGSAGPLREGKGSTWEGGMRVPALAWWPGTIGPGRVVTRLASTLDVFPTGVAIADGTLPRDREIDGTSLLPLFRAERDSVRDVMFFYRGSRLFALRKGPWKAHFITQSGYGSDRPVEHEVPELYHLDRDPSERHNVAAAHPEVIADLKREAERHRASMRPLPSQLDLPEVQAGGSGSRRRQG